VVIDADGAVAKARVHSAEAAFPAAKFALADTAVWVPIDGVVANRKTRVGEYLRRYAHALHRSDREIFGSRPITERPRWAE
jgi:multidrug resistance efflux pump